MKIQWSFLGFLFYSHGSQHNIEISTNVVVLETATFFDRHRHV